MKNTVFLLAIFTLAGCATVTRGSNEAFVIETTPPGAKVFEATNNRTCVSPCSIKVKRRPPLHITIEKDGYETVQTQVSSSVTGGGGAAMAGNILLGGIIGAGIDAGTGAMHAHKPNPLMIELEPKIEDPTGETIPMGEGVNTR